MPRVSAVIIACDNETTIADTLTSLAWCDERLVVDSGSRDRTRDICLEHGCRVIEHPFAGFGPQKRFAVSSASHDWVLVIDSDEIVTAELAAEIRARLTDDGTGPVGFWIPISLLFLGRLLRFGGEYGKLHLRLFNRQAGNFNDAEIHEGVELQGATAAMRSHILHASYRDVEHYFTKFNRYTTLAAEQADQRQAFGSRWFTVIRFPTAFVHWYLLRGLIFDGYPGFVWALFCSFYATVKLVKLQEIRDRRRRNKP